MSSSPNERPGGIRESRQRRLVAGSEAGLTVIELAVALALAVVLMLVAVWGIGAIFSSRLTADAEKLGAVIRYINHYAVRNNVPCRLVIDIESGIYYGEFRKGKGRFTLDVEELKARLKGEKKEEDSRFKDEEEEKRRKKLQAQWTIIPLVQFTTLMEQEEAKRNGNKQADKRVLYKTTQFRSVMTSHHDTASTEGRVEIYFFPDGTVERARITMGQEERNQILLLNPLTARIKRVNNEDKIPDEYKFE